MSELDASLNLDAINKSPMKKPWALSFSFGRALQASVIQTWKGKKENLHAAQQELLKLAKVGFRFKPPLDFPPYLILTHCFFFLQANGEAAVGKFDGHLELSAGNQSLFVANHAY